MANVLGELQFAKHQVFAKLIVVSCWYVTWLLKAPIGSNSEGFLALKLLVSIAFLVCIPFIGLKQYV
jgi:hypothetical protein